MTTVVNLRAVNEYDVYIGRAGRGELGTFGNPYKVGVTCERCGVVHGTGESTLPCFEAYLIERVQTDPVFKARLLALRGKVLGCFCKPKPCHGDVIVKWLSEQPVVP